MIRGVLHSQFFYLLRLRCYWLTGIKTKVLQNTSIASFNRRADATEPAIREKETETRDDREERGLVPEVRCPEVAEEADFRGLVLCHRCVVELAERTDSNVSVGVSVIKLPPDQCRLTAWLAFRSRSLWWFMFLSGAARRLPARVAARIRRRDSRWPASRTDKVRRRNNDQVPRQPCRLARRRAGSREPSPHDGSAESPLVLLGHRA